MISFQSDFDTSFRFCEEDNEHQEIYEQCYISNPLSNNILEELDDLLPKNNYDFLL